MADHEFLVCCQESEDGRLILCPVGGAPSDRDVSGGDVCQVVEVIRVNGQARSARVRNLTRAGEAN